MAVMIDEKNKLPNYQKDLLKKNRLEENTAKC